MGRQPGVHYIFSAFATTNSSALIQPIESVAMHINKYNFTQMHHTFQMTNFYSRRFTLYTHTYVRHLIGFNSFF